MDWKYKHFHQERVFAAPRDVVTEAARTFMTDSLGWQVKDTTEGLTAEGYSFTHRAIANIHLQSAGEETKVVMELLVERAGAWRGFMLFDVGGYYSIQVSKWLDGIQWALDQRLTGTHEGSTNPLVLAQNKPAAYIFNGCLVFIVVTFALYFLVTFISAVVGLLTGNLFLVGRGSVTVHGIAARVLSAVILICGAFFAWRIMSSKARSAVMK